MVAVGNTVVSVLVEVVVPKHLLQHKHNVSPAQGRLSYKSTTIYSILNSNINFTLNFLSPLQISDKPIKILPCNPHPVLPSNFLY